MSIEAMKQALEALENATRHIWLGDKNGVEANIRGHKQCESLRQAIAEAEKQRPELLLDGKTVQEACLLELYEFQQATGCNSASEFKEEKQEPVAWRHDMGEENGGWEYFEQASCDDCQPLYTHPQPKREWVGLTDDDELDWEEGGNLKDLVKAIEAKLKEKNT